VASVRRVRVPYGIPLNSQHSCQRGSCPLATAVRSPKGLKAWRHANTASMLSSVACAPAEAVWRGCRAKGVVNTRTRMSCKREVPACTPSAAHFCHKRSIPGRGGWLDLSRACFSQTFGIIMFCGIPATLMLSASAVADSYPWRPRMRYALGVVVFANRNRRYSRAHPSDATSSHRAAAWNISTFVRATIDVTRHCPIDPVASEWARSTPPNRLSHVSVMLLFPDEPGSSRSGPELLVVYVSRAHAVKRGL
jgi:hypothetical protein